MQNRYVRSVLDKNNEFRVEADFVIFDIMAFGTDVKLDTGATSTFVPIRTVGGLSSLEIQNLKYKDIKDKNIIRIYSRGIETGKNIVQEPKSIAEAMEFRNISFRHTLESLSIGGVRLGDTEANINYNFNGNILIGMDIMKNWDIHIGRNKHGETVFIGCPYSQLNQNYYLAIEKEFGLATTINAVVIKNNINKNNQ